MLAAKVTGYGIKQSSGFSDKWSVKNIYDLAGNVLEWTSEEIEVGNVTRGGYYNSSGAENSVSYRSAGSAAYTVDVIGFRVILYIK